MKNDALRIFAVLGLAVLLATPAAFAQLSETLVADIPFDFTVSGNVYPAGNYEVRPLTSTGILGIRSASQGVAIMTDTRPVWSAKTHAQPTLTFNRYGNQYFLSKITGPSSACELRPQKAERELASTTAAQPLSVVARVYRWR